MEVYAETIKHDLQRYPTVGDYCWYRDLHRIFISDTGNEDYNFLICIHELIESYLAKRAGIELNDIDKFDLDYDGEGEPGNDPDCPYREFHKIASQVEMLLCDEMDLDWEEYDIAVNKLFE